jgi:hypothetical protein
MRFWVVKGRPSRNDLREMLAPGRVEPWVTRRPPRAWEPGDGVFVWEAAPRLRVVGLAEVKEVHARNDGGETFFDLTYLTGVFDAPLTLEALRGDAEMATASFLKAGAAGTVFPLTTMQADRLLRLAKEGNVSARSVDWGAEPTQPEVELPTRALSIKQPWAELILRGNKTIEVRSRRTLIRGRVQIYASLGDVAPQTEARVLKVYGVDAREQPRGVLVGTLEIADCRPLQVSDSTAAGFQVEQGTTEYAWLLENPRRAKQLVKPKNHPQPVFFRPF